jgi:diguanylate cyclase (GGDEF)-like protein
MKDRYKSIRARLVVVITLLFAALSFVMVYIQSSVIERNTEMLHRSQRMSAAQMVKLYLELSFSGDWEIVDGKLQKGGRDFNGGSQLAYVLSDYLFPDTLIRFNAGTPPVMPPRRDLGDLLSERSRPRLPYRDDSNVKPPDQPFITAAGAGIAVRDNAGLPIGWIEVASDRDQRRQNSNRLLSSLLIGGTILSMAGILFFCFVVLRLTRPIDVMAEEHEAAKAQNEELAAISKTDPLTGLYNRRGLEAALREAWGCSDSPPSQLALIDIDHFKAVNDSRGHEEGDKVLAAIANLIARSIRTGDLCCRWGGEEFVIVFMGLEGEHASASAERLRRAVEAEHLGGEEAPLRVTVTIGLAQWRSGGFPEAVVQADGAMYRGKREGRNRVVLA